MQATPTIRRRPLHVACMYVCYILLIAVSIVTVSIDIDGLYLSLKVLLRCLFYLFV